MEGISGLIDWRETDDKAGQQYERARKLMALDANAAAIGAFDGGADAVVVNDSHGNMRNILVEDLDDRVRLISGSGKPLSMMQGVKDNDVAMFVGYHSRAHSRGVMNHTYTGSLLEYRINGQVYGESGMNALLAGHFGVPVIMVSGDNEVAAEAAEVIPGVRTVVVKDAVGQICANLIHPVRAREMIRDAAATAVRLAMNNRPTPLQVTKPVTLELRFARSLQADVASVMPGAERIGANAVSWQGTDYLDCYRAFRAMMALANW
jgi:D-amino peptidase